MIKGNLVRIYNMLLTCALVSNVEHIADESQCITFVVNDPNNIDKVTEIILAIGISEDQISWNELDDYSNEGMITAV